MWRSTIIKGVVGASSLIFAVAATGSVRAEGWSWDGADGDPGFTATWEEDTSAYDPVNQVYRVEYGDRGGGFPVDSITALYKDLGFAYSDFELTVDYTTHIIGQGVTSGLADNTDVSLPPQSAQLMFGVYGGPASNATALIARHYGTTLYDEEFVLGYPDVPDRRYRAHIWRQAGAIGGDLAIWDGDSWEPLGAELGPVDLPTLDEDFQYLRFNQSTDGPYGELWVHSIDVVIPEPATLTLLALGGLFTVTRQRR